MLESIKSIGRYAGVGALGGGGIAAVVAFPTCAWVGFVSLGLDMFLGGKSSSNLDAAAANFSSCLVTIIPCGIACGSALMTAVGLTKEVAKVILKKQQISN